MARQSRNNRQLPKSAPHRHHSHKWLTILFFVILIIVATIIIINVFKPIDFKDGSSTSSNNTSSEAIDSEDTNKEAKNDPGKDQDHEAEDSKNTASDGTPLGNEGSDPNSSSGLTGAITFSGVSEGKLLIRTNIDQYLTSGTCSLTLTSNTIQGVSYTQQAPIIPSVSSSTCDGFDYNVSEIRTGNYSIQIDLSSGDKAGTLKGEVSL